MGRKVFHLSLNERTVHMEASFSPFAMRSKWHLPHKTLYSRAFRANFQALPRLSGASMPSERIASLMLVSSFFECQCHLVSGTQVWNVPSGAAALYSSACKLWMSLWGVPYAASHFRSHMLQPRLLFSLKSGSWDTRHTMDVDGSNLAVG